MAIVMRFPKNLCPVVICLVLLCAVVGCQQRSASRLLGRWEGRTDSAAERAEREAKKYGEGSAKSQDEAAPDDKPQVTDWEKYDVTVVMDFLSSDHVEISLDGEHTQKGTWKIVSTAPASCTIEVQTGAVQTGAVQTESEADKTKQSGFVRRRFDLLLDEREGACVGFQLTETGADPQLGALYFSRPKNSAPSESN